MTSNFDVSSLLSPFGRPAIGAVVGTAVLILLGLLIAAVTSGLAPRLEDSGGPAVVGVPPARSVAASEAPPAPSGRASTGARGEQIGALARALSDRYRVSAEGLRPLLAAAYAEGERHAVDPLLVIAVMAVESRFNPIAESSAGAMGLMQVIPRMHIEKIAAASGRSVLDPATNIRVGVQVLKETIERGGSLVAGLQLYNGSAGDSTTAYAIKVLGEKRRLQEAARRGAGRSVS